MNDQNSGPTYFFFLPFLFCFQIASLPCFLNNIKSTDGESMLQDNYSKAVMLYYVVYKKFVFYKSAQ